MQKTIAKFRKRSIATPLRKYMRNEIIDVKYGEPQRMRRIKLPAGRD